MNTFESQPIFWATLHILLMVISLGLISVLIYQAASEITAGVSTMFKLVKERREQDRKYNEHKK